MYELCGRTKPRGGLCGSPALRGKSFCYFHDPRRVRAAKAIKPRYFLEVPLLEHRGALRAAISETLLALAAGRIDSAHGGRLLYALQLASTSKQPEASSKKPSSSPRYLKIVHLPGFNNIYVTGKQRDAASNALPTAPLGNCA